MATEMLRVETMSEAEKTLIGLLSPVERRSILVQAAQAKQRRLNKELLREFVQRVLRGEVEVQTLTDDGRPYPTLGKTFYFQNETTPMEEIGRVPGHTGISVLRLPDGSLTAINGFSLRRPNEIWEDLSANLSE